jgi:hypothetical protein
VLPGPADSNSHAPRVDQFQFDLSQPDTSKGIYISESVPLYRYSSWAQRDATTTTVLLAHVDQEGQLQAENLPLPPDAGSGQLLVDSASSRAGRLYFTGGDPTQLFSSRTYWAESPTDSTTPPENPPPSPNPGPNPAPSTSPTPPNSTSATTDGASDNHADHSDEPGPPGITLVGAAHCVDTRKFTFHLHQPSGQRTTRLLVHVTRRRARRLSGRNITRFTLHRLPVGRFVVSLSATTNAGMTVTTKRTYHGCSKSAPHGHRSHR